MFKWIRSLFCTHLYKNTGTELWRLHGKKFEIKVSECACGKKLYSWRNDE